MCKALVKGGVLGGIVIFIWSAISWMFLPWHMTTIHSFTNEDVLAKAIQAAAPQSGIYMMPMMTADKQLPQVFASIRLEGMSSMTSGMVISVIIQMIVAFLVTWLLTKAAQLSYWGRVWFVTIFGVAAAISAYLPYWNWFSFSTGYTLVGMADLVISWFLAGLVIAKCLPRSSV